MSYPPDNMPLLLFVFFSFSVTLLALLGSLVLCFLFVAFCADHGFLCDIGSLAQLGFLIIIGSLTQLGFL